MSQAGDNNNGAKKPDFGETFLGSAGSDAPPTDQAPQALDHFKRGYSERAHNREKDMSGFTNPDKPPMGSGGGPQKWQPPAGVKPNGGGGERPNNQYQPRPHQQQRNYNSYNNNYDKYDDKQYTRSYNKYDDRRGSYNNNRYNKGNGGFSMEDVVDRLCNPRANVFDEMDRARQSSPESFQSGRAITAILSQLGRRRQMGVAMQVWRWMDNAQGITRNVYHYNALINVCEKIKDWKMALDLMRQMDEERVTKNEITYSSAISACEKGGNWRTALDLLKTMKDKGIMPTAIAYNAAISACEKGLNPSKALEIFDEMKREGVRPTVVTFSALISACEKGQQWKLALQVLEEMKATFGPNVIAYSAAISALSKGQQWEKAWELFCEIEQSGEKLSVVTYNATMTALEKGLQWERALDLFDEMKYKNMPVTVVSYGSAISACEKGYQWRQCLEYLDEMTERKISKNVIIFGAAMSCMEKSHRADIAFQLMDRMKLERVRPNVHIYNSVISACARCKLWKKGFELFKEMDEVGVKRDVVTYNAVLDAVCSQVDLAEDIFHEGVKRGFYAKVSRLGTQWLELDLHFLSLGGGETALRWWFEKCLVPYLGDSKELSSVRSIDIVTGYGKTRARGARRGDDSMRKRVRAMLSFMNVTELEQPNLGRIHIDKQALIKEVERNGGKIVFDAQGYEQYKLQEGLDEPYTEAPQFVRPREGAMHDRNERDIQQQGGPRPSNGGQFGDGYHGNRNSNSQQHRSERFEPPPQNRFEPPPRHGGGGDGDRDYRNNNDRQSYSEPNYQSQNYNDGRNNQYDEWQGRGPNPRFEPPTRQMHSGQQNNQDYNRKRPYQDFRDDSRQGMYNNEGGSVGGSYNGGNSYEGNNNYGDRREYNDQSPNKRFR